MLKRLIKAALKNPFGIPRWLYSVLYIRFTGRVPFGINEVVSNFPFNGAGLPHFSSRLYKEVTLLNEALDNYSSKISLEIGCGYGRLTPWIAEHSERHYSIEPEDVLRSNAIKLYPKINFINAKAQELPFPDGYFDLCVSWTVLQHMPTKKELINAIDEIKRVCAENSVIILAEGVGSMKSLRYNEYLLEDWKEFFKPWKLTWSKERKLEETFEGYAGEVMRFTYSHN